uniref:Uncharacterized protein n=1 Tax=Solanum lycopersicum TaxID=4081 RepID=A0A3Q7EA18_SOLLC
MEYITIEISLHSFATEFRYLEHVILRRYPSSMVKRLRIQLPKFSSIESALVKGSYNFIGINHYTTW